MDNTQRLILRNQFKILALLDPDGGYTEYVDVLEHGYTHFYHELFDELYDETSEDDCNFVVDVLEMYRSFEHFKTANPESRVARQRLHHFLGFDGNSETNLMAFAQFVLTEKKRGLWQETRKYAGTTDNFDSHTPLRDRYARMLEKWASIGKPVRPTEAQVLEVIEAA